MDTVSTKHLSASSKANLVAQLRMRYGVSEVDASRFVDVLDIHVARNPVYFKDDGKPIIYRKETAHVKDS